jgi:phage virion morphogenesis protein
MGMEVKLINWKEARNLLHNLRPEIMEYQIETPLKEIGALSIKMARRSFNKKSSPSGKAWDPISETTFKLGKPRGSPPLVNSGRMKSGLLFRIVKRRAGREVIVGTNKPYWIHHQFGKPRNRLPETNIIAPVPARPFLGANSSDEARFSQIIAKWLEKYTGKRGRAKRRGFHPVKL